jgi:DNA-binding response OmpR family regulator
MSHHIFFAGKTVLLVEDELYAAEKLRNQLKALGYGTVLVATDLGTAMGFADEYRIDAAVLDVNLKDGETTIEFGWALAGDAIPVVFYSGYNAETMLLATRGQEFMEKPVSLPRLKASLLRAILRAAPMDRIYPRKKMAGQEARQ